MRAALPKNVCFVRIIFIQHEAFRGGHMDAIQLLLGMKGANLDVKDSVG